MWRKYILFLCSTILLTGCVQGNLHVTVRKDGSGIYQWKVLTNAYAKRYVQQMVTMYATKGYEAKLIREKGKVGLLATKPVRNIAKEPLSKEIYASVSTSLLSKTSHAVLSSTNQTQNIPIKELTIDSGFLQTTLLYQTQVNIKKTIDHLTGPYSSYVNHFLDKIHMRFLLTLPIAPTKNNANAVSKDGKTLTWNLKLGQNNPIQIGTEVATPVVLLLAFANNLTSYVPHFWPLSISWILLLFMLIALIIFLFRWLFHLKK